MLHLIMTSKATYESSSSSVAIRHFAACVTREMKDFDLLRQIVTCDQLLRFVGLMQVVGQEVGRQSSTDSLRLGVTVTERV